MNIIAFSVQQCGGGQRWVRGSWEWQHHWGRSQHLIRIVPEWNRISRESGIIYAGQGNGRQKESSGIKYILPLFIAQIYIRNIPIMLCKYPRNIQKSNWKFCELIVWFSLCKKKTKSVYIFFSLPFLDFCLGWSANNLKCKYAEFPAF